MEENRLTFLAHYYEVTTNYDLYNLFKFIHHFENYEISGNAFSFKRFLPTSTARVTNSVLEVIRVAAMSRCVRRILDNN